MRIIIAIAGIGIIIGFFLGKSSSSLILKNEINLSEYNKYGVLVIPILDSCPVTFTSEDSEYIEEMEVFSFDRHIRGLNSDEYMVVNHVGLASSALNFIHNEMKGCLPDASLVFSDSYTPAEAFEELTLKNELYDISLELPVYIRIKEGVIESFYKKQEGSN